MTRSRRVELPRAAVAALALAALVASALAAEVRLSPLLDPHNHAATRSFLRGLLPPDISPGFLRVAALAALRTSAIAVIGTTLSLAVAVPLGILGAATLFRRGPLTEGERRTPAALALAAASRAARAVLGFLRAVPDLVWALFFVVGVGLGPLAGVLAIAVAYGGVLGHVLAELFDSVDPRPLEALRSTGASRLQVFAFGIWPQALPSAVAYILYSFECCVRAAAVLGLVGAGGIGYEIGLSMRLFEYGQITTLVAALLGLVWLTDAASAALRRAMRANVPAGRLGHHRLRLGVPRASRGAVAALVAALGIAFAIACAAAAGVLDPSAIDASAPRRMAGFVRGMLPPELSPAYLRSLIAPAAETLGTSVIGTLIGAVLGGVLGIAAAAPHAEDDRAHRAARLARHGLRRLCRSALSLLRAIPEVLWVLAFLLAVGLGPFAGTLALGVHTAGVLGKLYADTLEEVSPLVLRGLRATGAGPLQLLIWGAWPEARRMLISYTVLRWEMNLRTSTVLGLAGGGGIGIALYNAMQLGFYPQVATLIAVIYALVTAVGWLGDAVRRRLESASLHARRR